MVEIKEIILKATTKEKLNIPKGQLRQIAMLSGCKPEKISAISINGGNNNDS